MDGDAGAAADLDKEVPAAGRLGLLAGGGVEGRRRGSPGKDVVLGAGERYRGWWVVQRPTLFSI